MCQRPDLGRMKPPPQRWPRHTFNLLTGLAACMCCTTAWSCDKWMLMLGTLCHITTLCFHGSHCVRGWEQWADRVVMKYDVAVVITIGTSAMVKTTDDIRLNVIALHALVFSLWLLTFGPLKGLPFNPIQSVIHLVGSLIHVYAASPVCWA